MVITNSAMSTTCTPNTLATASRSTLSVPKTGMLSLLFVLMRDFVRWLTAKYVPLQKKTAVNGQYLTPTLGRARSPALLAHSARKIKSASRDDRNSLHPPSPSFLFVHKCSPSASPRNINDRFAILKKKKQKLITRLFIFEG